MHDKTKSCHGCPDRVAEPRRPNVKGRAVATDADIESLYIRIEREGISDEGYWAAVNGIDF